MAERNKLLPVLVSPVGTSPMGSTMEGTFHGRQTNKFSSRNRSVQLQPLDKIGEKLTLPHIQFNERNLQDQMQGLTTVVSRIKNGDINQFSRTAKKMVTFGEKPE